MKRARQLWNRVRGGGAETIGSGRETEQIVAGGGSIAGGRAGKAAAAGDADLLALAMMSTEPVLSCGEGEEETAVRCK